MKYRKKPIVVDAIRFDGKLITVKKICKEFKMNCTYGFMETNKAYIKIPTLEGDMIASKGDWIIRGVRKECYPCKPDVFKKSYEKVV